MFKNVRSILPGVLLAAALAWLARWLHTIPAISAVSALMLAILLGMVVRNTIGMHPALQPGIKFSMRRLLRLAIMLLGFQLSLHQIQQVGGIGFLIVATTLVCTFLFTLWLGKLLGVDPKLTELLAAGTSICGASAVVATNTVTDGTDEDVAYAIAVVTALGTASVMLYPLASAAMTMPASSYGLWTGASIHEIAQVIAAAFQGGPVSAQYGTISKLSRVMLLAPVVFLLGYLADRKRGRGESGQGSLPAVPGGIPGDDRRQQPGNSDAGVGRAAGLRQSVSAGAGAGGDGAGDERPQIDRRRAAALSGGRGRMVLYFGAEPGADSRVVLVAYPW